MNKKQEISEPVKIKVLSHPRQYRFDCKTGVFKLGENVLPGKTFKLTLLDFKMTFEEKFGYKEPQDWLEILFLDEQNVMSSVFCKGISLQRFLQTVEEITVIEEQPKLGLQLEAEFEKYTSKSTGNQFFFVKFKAKEHASEGLLDALYKLPQFKQLTAPATDKEFDSL